MSFSVACGAAASSGPAGGRSRSRGTLAARASTRCSGRSAAGSGRPRRSLDEHDSTVIRSARYVDERGYSRRFRPHFLVPLTVGALVDRARARARLPGRPRDPLLRQPRHARLRPLPLADGRRAAAARTSTRCASGSGRGSTSGSASARCGATRTASSSRTDDGDAAPLRPRRRRDARRPGAARCSPTRATTSARVLGAFEYTENETVLHTDERFLPRTHGRARIVELPVERRRPRRR